MLAAAAMLQSAVVHLWLALQEACLCPADRLMPLMVVVFVCKRVLLRQLVEVLSHYRQVPPRLTLGVRFAQQLVPAVLLGAALLCTQVVQ
jgi:hypothetical protein